MPILGQAPRELLLFLNELSGITSTIRSDHVLNLFPEVDGVYPGDKEQMMQPVREFIELGAYEQMIFCIGRRTHRMARFSDLKNSEQRAYALDMCSELGATITNFDAVVDSIMQRFI